MVFLFIGDIIPFLGILLLNLVKMQIPTGSMSDTIIPFIWFCVAAIGICVFRCVASVAHLFYMLIGGYMSKNIQKSVIDITGVEIMPGKPTVCLGNGEQGFECCCDECDYYLLCFPEFDLKSMSKDNCTKQTEKGQRT